MKVDLDEIYYLALPESDIQGYFVENGALSKWEYSVLLPQSKRYRVFHTSVQEYYSTKGWLGWPFLGYSGPYRIMVCSKEGVNDAMPHFV